MTKKIQIAEWANYKENGSLVPLDGEMPYQMVNSDATGLPLLKLSDFGADIIRFDAGKGVTNHTHDGDHILFVLKGLGFVEYDGINHELRPGLCYLVPGTVDHAIKATTELVLIAVGNEHFPVDSWERMSLIETKQKNDA